MGSAVAGTAVDRLNTWDSLMRAVDRPAREALRMAGRPLPVTLTPALLGLFGVAVASAVAGLVAPEGLRLAPRLDALRAVFESLAVVVPGTLVFTLYLRLRLSVRTFLAASAIGLLAAGLVAVCVLPLMAFLVVVSGDAPRVLELPALLVPGLALTTVAAVLMRVITTLDGSRAAWWVSRAFVFFLAAVFLQRVHTSVLSFFFSLF